MTRKTRSIGVASWPACKPKRVPPCPLSWSSGIRRLTHFICRDTSMTDIWGRMVSYHFLNGTTRDNFFTNQTGHGAGELWSRVSLLPSYQDHSIPFPIIVADSVGSNETNTTSLSLNNAVYEVGTTIPFPQQCLRHSSRSHHKNLALGTLSCLR